MKNKKDRKKVSAHQLSPVNIVVRMPNWLGDAVMASPLLTDIRAAFPKAKLTVMCQKSMVGLFSHDPDVDETLSFVKPNSMRARGEIIDRLRAKHFDLGILLTGSFSSAWWFWRAGIPSRVGFAKDGRRFLLTHPAQLPPTWQSFHQVDVYKFILIELGILKSRTRPRLFCSEADMTRARGILKASGFEGKYLIGINPAAAYGPAKCWPKERFIEVSKRLVAQDNVSLLFFGDSASKPVVDEICEQIPGIASGKVINLSGKTTLKELVCLIRQCSVMLTNDSGPMHIAAAVGTPLVALFGSTNDVVTGPFTNKATVINKRVSCSPCYLRRCPIDFRCMKRIESDEVFERVISWIEHPKRSLAEVPIHAD
jgi:heptosyltransferase-2